MAERLGEAVLELRTNDAAFNSGVARAEGQAQKLGGTLDRASGSSAKLATEMVATGRSAAQMGAGFEQAGQRVDAAVGTQRQGMQQLSFQLGDIATMYALGARPAQIFASQIGQVTQAVQLMTGGTGRLAAFLGGPWGIALSSAVIVLAPFIGKLFEAEQAAKAAELGADSLATAQSALGQVFDTVSGKLKTQNELLILNARLTALNLRTEALQRGNSARDTFREAGRTTVADGLFGGGVSDSAAARAGIAPRASRGELNAERLREVMRGVESGGISADRAMQLSSSLNFGGTGVTREQFQQALIDRAFSADANRVANLIDQSLNQGELDPALRTEGPRARDRRDRAGPRARTAAELREDFDSQTFDLERQTLQARLSLATSAEDRADLQRDLLALERDQQIAQIEASDLTRDMKDALIGQVEALLGREVQFDEQGNIIATYNRGLEAEIIVRELAVRRLEQSQALADAKFQGETEALQNALALADTEAERKTIALRLLEAEEEFERIRLQTIIDAAARGEAEAEASELAQAQLASLAANSAGRRAVAARQNETETERYLRGLNGTSGQINEAIEGIQIDGLEALNDGLTDAILGAESLGDVFSRVADQIIADLLRIAIQQAIIRPLANALFGGGGGDAGGGGGVFGSLFAGLFAEGGTIPTGQFGIVGEEGPEIAIAGPGGLGILSNSDSRALVAGGGGMNVAIPINIDATGADAAAIARLNSRLDQLQEELPGRIVTTVQDASNRRIINVGGGR